MSKNKNLICALNTPAEEVVRYNINLYGNINSDNSKFKYNVKLHVDNIVTILRRFYDKTKNEHLEAMGSVFFSADMNESRDCIIDHGTANFETNTLPPKLTADVQKEIVCILALCLNHDATFSFFAFIQYGQDDLV